MISSHTPIWTVVGAGPAGILAVGRLLDAGVAPKSILWLDPEFAVGDFGKYWFAVPSNTRIALFAKFLQATKSFDYSRCPKELTFAHLNESDTCLLEEMVKPLQWVTKTLCAQVAHQKCTVRSLQQSHGGWHLTTTAEDVFSSNVILALGSVPKSMTTHYALEANEIALNVALNPTLLQETVRAGEHVAAFGSSHSGVLVMKNLLAAGCRVTNFYRSPLRYALYQEDHIIYDNTGLKGSAAQWAKENLQGQTGFDSRLTRRCLADCTTVEIAQSYDHVVYATGFTARHLSSHDLDCRQYDARTGIIAPGLFGLGIAYPEAVTDRYGINELSVGLFKFSNYITRVLPLWMQYENSNNISKQVGPM